MADKSINELPAATSINPADLFVLQQQSTNSARSLEGQVLVAWLTNYADGHGGIQSIAKTSTSGLVDTYTISYADGSTGTFTVTNGARGDTGAAAYVWIKWASQEPTADNQMSNNPDNWIGIYSGTASTAPTTYTSYKWFQYKGETGEQGETGASIASVTRTSGDGSPGTYDTYTITLDTGTVAGTFQVWNGLNGTGAVNSVNSIRPDTNGNVQVAAVDVGAVPVGQGLPAGGTVGQILTKNSQTDYSVSWSDPPDEGADYIKFPDGTLICWGHAGTGGGVSQSSFGALWAVNYPINYTFPVPFIDYPCISGSNRGGVGCVFEIDYTPTQLNNVTLARQTNANIYVNFYWVAIGRWK